MKTFSELLSSLSEAPVAVARADYKLDKDGRKHHNLLRFKDGEDTDAEDDSEEQDKVKESVMTDAEKKARERYVKGMKKNIDSFKAKYGSRAKDVMYATATKMAMKEEVEQIDEDAPLKHHTAIVSYRKNGDPHRRYEARFKTTHNGGKEETEKRVKTAFAAKGRSVYNIVHEEVALDEAAQGHTIEAHGIKGMKGTPWRKTFKHEDHLNDWADKNDSVEVHGVRDLEHVKRGSSSSVKEGLDELDTSTLKSYAAKAMQATLAGKKDRNDGMSKAYSRLSGTNKPLGPESKTNK
jgi:hypothetical protein